MPRPLLYWLHAVAYSDNEFLNFEGARPRIDSKEPMPPGVCI
jgi:hypothetical protein